LGYIYTLGLIIMKKRREKSRTLLHSCGELASLEAHVVWTLESMVILGIKRGKDSK
jgi:hypothetical protein